ncbi:sensor histidine kinase [Hymenobacter sp.]|jgi:nitrate/nitrite-specific signal transduction histidine kinase|uniref:sensor histidine kinase n=1 Tax=Hymenobacter sp. TaxID=1898978 RepID=UPI002ED910F4
MQRTIKSKLTLGLGFLFLIILLLSGVGAYFLYQLSRNSTATLRDNYRSVGYSRYLSDALSDLRDARLAGAGTNRAAQQTFQRYLTAERNNITEPGEQELADSLTAGFQQYLTSTAAAEAGQYQQLRQQINRVGTLNLRAIEEQAERTRRIANRTIGTLGLLAAVGILATLSFIFSFPDYITKPIQELTAGIRRVADGNYAQRLPSHHDEFADVVRAFNDMAHRLEGYETADGTPRIDSTGPLDLVTAHHRPGTVPATVVDAEQQRLLAQLQDQTRQLQRTAALLIRER